MRLTAAWHFVKSISRRHSYNRNMTAPARNDSNVEQAVPSFWVHNIEESVRFYDPDGYKLFFESPTDVAEDTVLTDPEIES